MRIILLSLLLAACTYPGVEPTTLPAPTLEGVVDAYPCGYGFQAGNPEQTIGVFLNPIDFALFERQGPQTVDTDLPGGNWGGVVAQGSNLFANWCDDVFEEGEPTPYRAAELPIVAGHLTVTLEQPQNGCAGLAITAELTGLVVEVDGERVDLGDLTITNEAWGCFAG